jgi:ribokinase
MKEEIVVVGSLNLDMVTKVRERPKIGETIICEEYFNSPGGKGANQAYSSAALGGVVRMIGKVGNDPHGQELIAQLKKINVKTDAILIDPAETTGIANIIIDKNGDNSIIVIPGANHKLAIKDIRQFQEYILNAKLVVLQLEIPIETVKEVINIAFSNNIPILLDPSPVPDGGLEEELLKKITYITPNITELNQLTGKTITNNESVYNCSGILLEKGIKYVFAKLGNRGVVVSSQEESYHVPGFAVKTLDTTAAGDTFIGALATTITKNMPISECVKTANAAAAITVTRFGAQNAMPTLTETKEFIDSYEGGIVK